MKPKATFVNTLPEPKAIIGSFINNLFSSKKFKFLFLKPNIEALNELSSSNLQILVSKIYSFDEMQTAYQEIKENGVMGKAVIKID